MRRAALGTGQGQAKTWLGDVFTADSSANLKLLNGNKLLRRP